ncbi:tRNA adenosine(34) deaminase TadA [Paraferrimonas haliotis]|uniref:tRNA-specific adenosine deaminase n=1 Tax=Paraferrimonas haliotis TaxID=2013866 RepID=A0AA37TMC0_9GAMM|nr:tRNA adenosine(34) deaminase TadA [Paraferrimonas haliotis]GLS82903.1 tRNA-specific adenosine deaminase [Paraferrimonas haliotis]
MSKSLVTSTVEHSDEYWMQQAMQLAHSAQELGEVPVGAILVKDGVVVAQGINRSICDHNACAHAEIQCLQAAGQSLQNYRLIDTTLYVTLEPCPMCAGAIVHARVKRVVFGAYDYKTGAAGSVMNLLEDSRLNHQAEVVGGVLEQACAEQLSGFFKLRRQQQKALKKAQKVEQQD